jgi:lipopolysaccharide export system protein LptA
MTKQLVLVALILLLAAGVSLGQNSVKTQTADLVAPNGTLVFNYLTGEFTMTGGVTVKMQGTRDATMTAPKVTGKLSHNNQVSSLVAYGPVHLEIITAPDAEGNRGDVKATADDRAEYSEITQKITLIGNAVADYISLPEGPDSRRAHFTGEAIEADLNTSMLTVTKAHITVQTPLKPPEAPAAPAGTPAPAPKK